jgi:hypothetical protein
LLHQLRRSPLPQTPASESRSHGLGLNMLVGGVTHGLGVSKHGYRAHMNSLYKPVDSVDIAAKIQFDTSCMIFNTGIYIYI